tara:strand:- start:163 stop:354 length:192 start_codon:yes stop_codon:yes gene_type:complete
MKIDLEDKNMKVELTQKEIDRLYFNLKDYVKVLNDVDKLNELNISQQEMYKTELELIKKFSKL